MEKHIDLARKLKALADRGVGGEKRNAQKILDSLLKKHSISIEEIEGDKIETYYFKASGIYSDLLHQIVKRVNYNLKVWEVPVKAQKKFRVAGNIFTECTAAEYIEIDQMFSVYKKLFKEESDFFFKAFLTANDLLARPPKEQMKTTNDLSPEEYAEWLRTQGMASKIRKETIRKQISTGY